MSAAALGPTHARSARFLLHLVHNHATGVQMREDPSSRGKRLSVVAPNDRGKYSLLDLIPGGEHLPIAEPQNPIAADAQQCVATSIGLKSFRIGVVLGAIDLNDEPLADKEVDPSDPGNRDLTHDAQMVDPHSDPEQSLSARLADAVHPLEPGAVGGGGVSDESSPLVREPWHPVE